MQQAPLHSDVLETGSSECSYIISLFVTCTYQQVAGVTHKATSKSLEALVSSSGRQNPPYGSLAQNEPDLRHRWRYRTNPDNRYSPTQRFVVKWVLLLRFL